MPKQTTHTALPWHVEMEIGVHHDAGRWITVNGLFAIRVLAGLFNTPDKRTISSEERDANAQFIVKACNNYEETVEALRSCLEWMEFTIPHLHTKCPHCGDRVDVGGLNWGGPIRKARNALTKAGYPQVEAEEH